METHEIKFEIYHLSLFVFIYFSDNHEEYKWIFGGIMILQYRWNEIIQREVKRRQAEIFYLK